MEREAATINILFISSRFPYPPLKGDQLIVYHRLRTLSEYHKIFLITFYEHEEERSNIEQISEFCEKIYLIKINKCRSFMNVAAGLFFSRFPMQVNYFVSNDFEEALKYIFKNHKIDLVHIFLIRMMNYYDIIKFAGDYSIVLEAIDSMQLNLTRRLSFDKGIVKLLFKEELNRVKVYEPFIGNQVDQIIVVAEKDRDQFLTSNVSIVHNGVDRNEFYPECEVNKHEDRIIFSGNMGYKPNIIAVSWFLEKCFPLLKKRKPNIIFYIVGGNVSREIKNIHNRCDVFVTGYVKSMGNILRKCKVAIAPMQSGSGMQNKILEAMASGLPVVTTEIGLGDIKAVHGKQILVANSAEQFCEQILLCLTDDCMAKEIVQNAMILISKNHSWETGAKKINGIYSDAMKVRKQSNEE